MPKIDSRQKIVTFQWATLTPNMYTFFQKQLEVTLHLKYMIFNKYSYV